MKAARSKRTPGFPAISVCQPWADLIIDGKKPIENRKWQTRFRGWVLIHAGKRIQEPTPDEVHRLGPMRDVPTARGAVIGMVRIVDCVEQHRSRHFSGPYGFVLTGAMRFRRPVAYRGQLGIFRVPLRYLKGTSAVRVKPGSSEPQ